MREQRTENPSVFPSTTSSRSFANGQPGTTFLNNPKETRQHTEPGAWRAGLGLGQAQPPTPGWQSRSDTQPSLPSRGPFLTRAQLLPPQGVTGAPTSDQVQVSHHEAGVLATSLLYCFSWPVGASQVCGGAPGTQPSKKGACGPWARVSIPTR